MSQEEIGCMECDWPLRPGETLCLRCALASAVDVLLGISAVVAPESHWGKRIKQVLYRIELAAATLSDTTEVKP